MGRSMLVMLRRVMRMFRMTMLRRRGRVMMVSSPLLDLMAPHELVPGVDHERQAGDTGPGHCTDCSHPGDTGVNGVNWSVPTSDTLFISMISSWIIECYAAC